MSTCLEGDKIKQIHSKRIKVGNLDINYISGGDGSPLVLIHGGLGDASRWLQNLSELLKIYTIYAPDLPGFGNSQSISEDFQVSEFVSFINDFTDTLELKRFHLMGHSLGGGIALHFALKYPQKIDRLVIVSSMFLGKDIALWARFSSSPFFLKLFGETGIAIFKAIKWLFKILFAPYEFAAPFSRLQMSIGKNLVTLQGQTVVLLTRLSEIIMPTLIVWGTRDEVVPAKHAYATAKLIPDCQVYVFKGGSHNVYQQRVGEFSKLITRFLDRES
jgi:pimeloyl-ACP methyl ester carboxylesterase